MEELQIIQKIIELSLKELLDKDSEIFTTETKVLEVINLETGVHDRKLHETAINHRFAVYLERYLNEFFQNDDYYQIDIEYNRWFGWPKELNGDIVRPDIIIHRRMGEDLAKDNLLVVEAKKDIISEDDEEKVIDLMNSPKYNYKYGLTVTYCAEHDTRIAYKIFHNIVALETPIKGYILK